MLSLYVYHYAYELINMVPINNMEKEKSEREKIDFIICVETFFFLYILFKFAIRLVECRRKM